MALLEGGLRRTCFIRSCMAPETWVKCSFSTIFAAGLVKPYDVDNPLELSRRDNSNELSTA